MSYTLLYGKKSAKGLRGEFRKSDGTIDTLALWGW